MKTIKYNYLLDCDWLLMWIKCTEQFFLQHTNHIFYHMVTNCCFWWISLWYKMIPFINLHCLLTQSCSVIPLIYTVCLFGVCFPWPLDFLFSLHFNVCFSVIFCLFSISFGNCYPGICGYCFSCLMEFCFVFCHYFESLFWMNLVVAFCVVGERSVSFLSIW